MGRLYNLIWGANISLNDNRESRTCPDGNPEGQWTARLILRDPIRCALKHGTGHAVFSFDV